MKHSMNKISIMVKTLLLTSMFAAGAGVYGDDTEVFYSVNVSKPNLLFVLDVSGSMNTMVAGAATGEPGEDNKLITNGGNDSFQNRTDGARTSGSQIIDISTDTYPRFRFTDINVPQNAEITNAYIQFTSAGTDTGNANFSIFMDRSDNAPQNANIFSAALYGTPNWVANESWSPGDRGPNQRTNNIAPLIQNVVNRGGWQSGNAMGFYLGANDRNRMVAAFEHPNWASPELHISYVADSQSRLDVLKDSFRAVLEQAPDNVQVGLMNYGQSNLTNEVNGNYEEKHRHHSVSGVTFPITDINDKANTIITSDADRHGLPSPGETTTIREYIADVADTWTASSFTPIVDALYEAALYYRGEKMHYGQRPHELGGAHPKTHLGIPVILDITDTDGPGRDNSTAQKYRTPIESSCQENYIVLMTDGAPTYRYLNNQGNWASGAGPFASIRGNTQGPKGTLASAVTSSCVTGAGVGAEGNCGAELTHYLADNDNLPNATIAFPDGQPGEQTIGTYTVGFGVNSNTETYLKSLATIDDGNASTDDDGYFAANSPEELARAFKDIFDAVAAPKGTLASPGYSVNVKSGLEHEKDIYIPVFDRRNSSRWAGNLKKFKIVDDAGKRKIRGSNSLDAVDELGGFLDQAIDYWSSAPDSDPDGKVVQRGGLANLLNPAVRNIVSDVAGNNLTNAANQIVANNNSLTNDVLGLASTADQDYRNIIINFMRGWVNGDATSADKEIRYHMGDMLHSEPLVVTYDDGASTGSSGTKKQYIFAGTNEGYLHAFDTSDDGPNAGKEMFAYIPKELLGSISEHQYLNSGSQAEHKYGVDGSLTYRIIDQNDNGIVDVATDKVILYFGLRRGGSSFYALDVTNVASPKLLWKVTKSTDSTNALSRLGQSWSAPYLARVGVNNSSSTCDIGGVQKTHCKEVVIVSGGYDSSEDRDRTFCANENGTCTIPTNKTTTVWYGANNTWVSKDNVTGSIGCNNGVFSDPLPGVFKSCRYESKSGEYDSTLPITANVGNDVFIFDANDGSLVWSLPDSEQLKLSNSIPGGVRILDTNSNKLIDRMYFGDTGGNIWRLDLSESIEATDNVSKLNKLANLGGTGRQSRKFFNEPDVSRLKLNGKSKFLVSMGSGFRAHPLDKAIDDKYFMVVDESPYSPIETTGTNPFTSIVKSELATITVSDNSVTQSGSIKDTKGWVVNLPSDGEKVLATSVTVDGVVLFTTLVPEVLTSGVNIDQCAAPATQGRLYAIDVISGGKAKDPLAFELEDSSGGGGGDGGGNNGGGGPGTSVDIGGGGTYTTISKGEIPGKPQAIFNSLDVNDSTGECTHPVDVRIGKKLSQATGYEACRLESIYWSDPETK